MSCRVYVIRKPFRVPRTHHVAVLVVDLHGAQRHRLFEHSSGIAIPRYLYKTEADLIVEDLGDTAMTIEAIEAYEKTLPKHYLLGVRDCRHHASDILEFCGVFRNANVAYTALTARASGSESRDEK